MAPRPPKHARLNPELAKTHMPPDDKVLLWYTVKNPKYDNLGTIAAQFHMPPEKLIEFNFPGSVEHGDLVPEIVNWYLANHVRFLCPETPDKKNRIFKGGERIAIPRPGHVPSGPPSSTNVTVAAPEESPPQCLLNSLHALNWKIRWSTSGRNGFIVQEIKRTRWARECGSRNKMVVMSSEHFWEVFSVDSQGTVNPPFDFWIITAFPHTETRFSIDGKVFFVTTLDPKAGFAPTATSQGQLETKKQPSNLGAVLLHRHQGGTFFDCGVRRCEPEKPKP